MPKISGVQLLALQITGWCLPVDELQKTQELEICTKISLLNMYYLRSRNIVVIERLCCICSSSRACKYVLFYVVTMCTVQTCNPCLKKTQCNGHDTQVNREWNPCPLQPTSLPCISCLYFIIEIYASSAFSFRH